MIICNNWFCRLGNNIIQLYKLIRYAIYHKHNMKFNCKKHPYFNVSVIEEYFNKYNHPEILINDGWIVKNKNGVIPDDIVKKNFLKHASKEEFEKINKEAIDVLKQSFTIKQDTIDILEDTTIVVHVRSGDVFDKQPHMMYVPPPLSYYVNILNASHYTKIIIVCEDSVNPIVNKLLELYKNATFKKQSLTEDIKIILGAKTIINSVGSFIPFLLLLSENNKTCHSIDKDEHKEYYTLNSPWKANTQQRDNILKY